jgi:opacity protein-like surface antigen
MKKFFAINFLFSFVLFSVLAQENLLDQLKTENDTEWTTPTSTFKAVRLINGHTVETRKKGNLEFLISHRFGRINSGAYEFFGMDQANMRLGLDYSVKDWLTLGVGRNSFQKVYDGFAKISLHRQGQKKSKLPISIVWFSNTAINTFRRDNLPMNFQRRLNFTHQILLASKLNQIASVQLMPTYIHRNLVSERDVSNELFALGGGLSYKITRSVYFNVEYYHRFTKSNTQNTNPLSIGVDIETGGHVFQLHVTNAQEMTETGFIPSTTGDIMSGDIHFGFNITRNFQLTKPK